jgi:hypothetical protein
MAVTPVFVSGIPARIDRTYFRDRYGQNFPDLLLTTQNAFLDASIEDIYTMFTGINTLWKSQVSDVWFYKTQLCFGLLLAWYITDLHPELAVGIVTAGGIPVKSKSIGGVKVTFGSDDADGTSRRAGYRDSLAPLKSNPFGYKAYQMMRNAGAMTSIRGRNVNV